jgi:hypothetical protein
MPKKGQRCWKVAWHLIQATQHSFRLQDSRTRHGDDTIAGARKPSFDGRVTSSTTINSFHFVDTLPYVPLRQAQPELASAAVSNPRRFAELLKELSARRADQERQRLSEIERLNADPFDVEAQRKIEEAIRQEAVLENWEHALEYSPESFGRVTML